MDTVDKPTRLYIMSRVGRKDTGPELILRRELHRLGLRYRLHEKKLPGSPDLVFPRFGGVIFVHGCYWHSHGCYKSTVPLDQVARSGPKNSRPIVGEINGISTFFLTTAGES